MKIREAREDEFLKVHHFIESCPPLEVYPVHLYKIILRYFRKVCLIAEEKGEILGLATGFVAQVPGQTCFFWQVGVSPQAQGKGLGKKIVSFFEEKAKKAGCCRIELTVDTENIPSQKLFERLGYANASPKEKETLEYKGKIAAKNYYGPGRHFLIYAKTL